MSILAMAWLSNTELLMYLQESQCAEIYTIIVMVSIGSSDFDSSSLQLPKHQICMSDYIIIQLWFPYHFQQDYKQVTSVWPEQCHWAVGIFPLKWVRLPSACPLGEEQFAKLALLPTCRSQPLVFYLLPLGPAGKWVICKAAGPLFKSTFIPCTASF